MSQNAKVGKRLYENLVLTSGKAKRLSKFGNKSPYNKLFTKKELDNVVTNLPNAAPGPDMIFPQFVKALPEKWMNVLLEVINLAWDSGVFLSPWKHGQAVMIPKPNKDKS